MQRELHRWIRLVGRIRLAWAMDIRNTAPPPTPIPPLNFKIILKHACANFS